MMIGIGRGAIDAARKRTYGEASMTQPDPVEFKSMEYMLSD